MPKHKKKTGRIPIAWKRKKRKLKILFVLVFSVILITGFFAIRNKWFAIGEIDAKKVIPSFYSGSLEVSLGKNKLTVTPLAGNQVKVIKKDIRYIYENAYKNTDVIQTEYPYKIKEELIFYGKGHPLEFKYRLGNIENFIVEKDKEGNIIFYDRKEHEKSGRLSRIFTIPAPFIEDKITKRSFTAVKTSIEGDLFIISIDPDWMENASYPVILDPTIEINIIDVHSSPETGQNWDVRFTTRGKADLKIIPDDQATIEEDEFTGLYCDNVKMEAQILPGDVIFYPDWKCEGTGLVIHKTLRVGKHTLRFEYGGAVAYAYNNPYVTIDSTATGTAGENFGPSPTTVFVDDNNAYAFYVDSGNYAVYSKSTDGGTTWNAAVTVDSQTDVEGIAVWYDKWTPGDSGTIIHIATFDSGDDDVFYASLDTSTDTLVTAVIAGVAQSGGIAAGTNNVALTKTTDGKLYIGMSDDSDHWIVTCSSGCNSSGNWSEITSPYDAAADFSALLPGPGGDMMVIRYDISGNDYDYRKYDGASWVNSWTTIVTTVGENTTYDPHFSVTMNKANYDIYLAYTDDNNVLGGENDDIETYTCASGSWSAGANVKTNSTRGITGVAIAFDENNNDVYVAFSARNSPSIAATANVYWLKSIDNMVTWIGEQGPFVPTDHGDLYGLRLNFSSSYKIYATWYQAALDDLFGDTLVDTTPATDVISVGTSGVIPDEIFVPATDEHIGTFTFIRDSGSANVTQLIFNEEGSVNANSYLSNLDVYYETAAVCSYDGNETLFGTAASFNVSDQATVTGTMAIGTSQICVYVLVDVSSSAASETLRFEISDPPNDITVSAGSITQTSRIIVRGGSILRGEEYTPPVTIDATASVNTLTQNNNSTSTVFIDRFVGYTFYVDSNGTAVYSKTTDGGETWGSAVTVDSQTDVQGIAIWYDKWTPLDQGTYIHIATFDSGADDTWYARLDAATDTVNTAVMVPAAGNAGTIAAGSNNVSITKATNGALYIGMSDDGDHWVTTCTTTCTTNTNWSEITSPFDAQADFTFMVPLKDGDIMIVRYDISGNDYDYRCWDGANWDSWTTIVTTSGENTTYDPHFGVAINTLTYDTYLVYVDDTATLGTNDDIETYSFASGSWSAKGDVVTNDARGIMNAVVGIEQDTGTVYVAYSVRDVFGLVETGQLFWKRSTDGMTSWSSEGEPINLTEAAIAGLGITMAPRERMYLTFNQDDYDQIRGATIFTVGGGAPIRIKGNTRIKGGTRLNLEDSGDKL